jgi:hypothetical protein
MISDQYGEKKLVKLYSALSDSAGPGWPDETVDVLGVGRRQLVHDWRLPEGQGVELTLAKKCRFGGTVDRVDA